MGGYGSGIWIRSSTKPLVERYQRLEIGDIKRQGVKLIEGMEVAARFEYQGRPVSHALLFSWTSCHYGGQRPWFFCPSCGCRVAVLYLLGQSLACRHCGGLTYASRNENVWFRAIRRAHKIRVRLGGKPNSFLPLSPRPKGMHRATYYRLARRCSEATEESFESFLKWAASAEKREQRGRKRPGRLK
jgi:hypothetical protein